MSSTFQPMTWRSARLSKRCRSRQPRRSGSAPRLARIRLSNWHVGLVLAPVLVAANLNVFVAYLSQLVPAAGSTWGRVAVMTVVLGAITLINVREEALAQPRDVDLRAPRSPPAGDVEGRAAQVTGQDFLTAGDQGLVGRLDSPKHVWVMVPAAVTGRSPGPSRVERRDFPRT